MAKFASVSLKAVSTEVLVLFQSCYCHFGVQQLDRKQTLFSNSCSSSSLMKSEMYKALDGRLLMRTSSRLSGMDVSFEEAICVANCGIWTR